MPEEMTYQVRVYFNNGNSRLAHNEALSYFKKEALETKRAFRRFYGKSVIRIELEETGMQEKSWED